VDHPFDTPKMAMGDLLPDEASAKGRTEMALHVLAYNLTVMNIMAFGRS